jgi:hypothetical protein
VLLVDCCIIIECDYGLWHGSSCVLLVDCFIVTEIITMVDGMVVY